jgi:hypothetical protein
MTLADISLPVSYAWSAAHVLAFDSALTSRLGDVQEEHGDSRHVPNPRQLTDGRWMLRADILTECIPGGLLYGGFSHLDADRFDEIEVLPLADALALLPQEPAWP